MGSSRYVDRGYSGPTLYSYQMDMFRVPIDWILNSHLPASNWTCPALWAVCLLLLHLCHRSPQGNHVHEGFPHSLALYDGCIGIGGWECSNYDSSGPDFNGFLCLLPVLGALPFLLPISELTRGSLVVGMFYGLIMSLIVLFFSFMGGFMLMMA